MPITKKYKANTNISVNVVLPSKKNLHISFTPLSNGSSVYATDKEDVQNALERHYQFGKLFRIAGAENAAASKPEKADDKEGDSAGNVRKVKVSDIASAKDFLADTFGISRTSMRTKQSIMDAAKAQGIEFEGL